MKHNQNLMPVRPKAKQKKSRDSSGRAAERVDWPPWSEDEQKELWDVEETRRIERDEEEERRAKREERQQVMAEDPEPERKKEERREVGHKQLINYKSRLCCLEGTCTEA